MITGEKYDENPPAVLRFIKDSSSGGFHQVKQNDSTGQQVPASFNVTVYLRIKTEDPEISD